MPTILDNAISSTKCQLQQSLLYVMAGVNMLTTYIEASYKVIEVFGRYKLVHQDNFVQEIVNPRKDLLIMFRQYELSIR